MFVWPEQLFFQYDFGSLHVKIHIFSDIDNRVTRERFICEAETLLLSMSESQHVGLWPGLPMLADKVRAMYSSYFIDVFYAFVVVSIVYIAFQFARVFYIFVWRPLSVLRKLQRQGVPGCKFVPLVGQTRELLHVRR